MSARIASGYRVDSRNLAQFGKDLTAQIRPVFLKSVQNAAARMLLEFQQCDDLPRRIEHIVDEFKLDSRYLAAPPSRLWAALNILDQIQVAQTRPGALREPLLDMTMEVAFVSDQEQPETPLAILFTEQNAYRQVFRRMPQVSEYRYWDDADKPSHISAKEWAERGEAWDRALPDAGIPARNGVSWQLPMGLWRFDKTMSKNSMSRKLKRSAPSVDWFIWLGQPV